MPPPSHERPSHRSAESSSIVHPQLRATDQYVVEWYMDQFYDVSNGSHNKKSHSYSSSDVEELATISYDMLESNDPMKSTENSGSYALCICWQIEYHPWWSLLESP